MTLSTSTESLYGGFKRQDNKEQRTMSNTEEITTGVSVSSRTMLWDKVGAIFADQPKTAEDAVKAAGLDWEVELRPLGYHNAKGNFIRAQGHYGTVRTDTDALLGTVKSRYKVFQNREAFDFANVLVDDYGANFECGFETHGGKVVGLTMKLPDTIQIAGQDPFQQYLALRTTHDGSGSIRIAISMMRMACLNQFDIALGGAKHRWAISHTQKATHHLAAAREALEITFKYDAAFADAVEQLMNTELGTKEREMEDLDRILIGRRCGDQMRAATTEAAWANLQLSDTIPDEHRTTAYGWMNAVTELFEHKREYRTAQSAFLGNTEGLAYHVRNELAQSLLVRA